MTKVPCLIGVLFSALSFVFVPTVFAQSVLDSTQNAPTLPGLGNQANGGFVEIGGKDLKDLEPSWKDRLLRVWQYQYQFLEQPDFLVVNSGGVTQTIPNPNGWLHQHSILVKFAELFPRTTNLPALVQAASDHQYPGSAPFKLSHDLCRHGTMLECLAGGGGFWGRLFSGASLTFSVAQRPEVQQGVVVTGLSASQAWAWNGQLDFNPESLFITSTNWKNAVSTLSQRKFDEENCLTAASSSTLKECEEEYAKSRLNPSTRRDSWARLATVTIPTIQLKALSQFDFIKQGGALTEDPRLQRSLKSMTFTWDLRHLIPTTTDRLAVATMYNKVAKPGDRLPTSRDDNLKASKLCVLFSGTFRSYINVTPDSTMNSCRGVATDLGSVDHFAVACATDRKVSIGIAAAINEYPGEKNKPEIDCGWSVAK